MIETKKYKKKLHKVAQFLEDENAGTESSFVKDVERLLDQFNGDWEHNCQLLLDAIANRNWME